MNQQFKAMKIGFNIFLLVLLSILFMPNNVFGQTIRGKVVLDGEPAFAANVYLLNNRGIGTLTGEEGLFNLSVPDSLMNDTLVVHFLGYKDSLTPLNEIKDFYTICMQPDQQGVLLREVVVRADPTISKEFATTKLEKSSIYMNPASGADPLKAIHLLPYSVQNYPN